MMEIPLEHAVSGRPVLIRALIIELGFQIVVDGGDKRAGNSGVGWIVAGVFAGRIHVLAFKAHVVAAQGHAIVAQHLLAEARGRDAQVGFLYVIHAEAGEMADLLGHRIQFLGRELVAFKQRVRVSPPAANSRACCTHAATSAGLFGTLS